MFRDCLGYTSLYFSASASGGAGTMDESAEEDKLEPASLIIVIGTSLAVLRHYSYLWPQGLGRCFRVENGNNNKKTSVDDISQRPAKRPRLSENQISANTKDNRIVDQDKVTAPACELAIINLQPTCKDGLATFISRRACDDLLRDTLVNHLGLNVPDYDANRDPLREVAIPLDEVEDVTHTRPYLHF